MSQLGTRAELVSDVFRRPQFALAWGSLRRVSSTAVLIIDPLDDKAFIRAKPIPWIIENIHESRKILVDNMIRQKYKC